MVRVKTNNSYNDNDNALKFEKATLPSLPSLPCLPNSSGGTAHTPSVWYDAVRTSTQFQYKVMNNEEFKVKIDLSSYKKREKIYDSKMRYTVL